MNTICGQNFGEIYIFDKFYHHKLGNMHHLSLKQADSSLSNILN